MRRSTPAGQHRPVLLQEVLETLRPTPGDLVVDGTLGWAGHASEFLKLVTPGGRLIGCDLDPENLPRARERLEAIGGTFQLHHSNFAGLATIVAEARPAGAKVVLADLGMSSMQVDDPERGFSYSREGPLDMRMDRTRGRTAAQVLANISVEELSKALRDFSDEPEADRLAQAIVDARASEPLATTTDLARLLQRVSGQENWRLHPTPGKWNLHPAARTFQALRILVNRELANLEHLLRHSADDSGACGRAGIISFHSGEDRLVKAAFQQGHRQGVLSRDRPGADSAGPLGSPGQSPAAVRQATLGFAGIKGEEWRSPPLFGRSLFCYQSLFWFSRKQFALSGTSTHGCTAHSQRTTTGRHGAVTACERTSQDQRACPQALADDRAYQEGQVALRASRNELVKHRARQTFPG